MQDHLKKLIRNKVSSNFVLIGMICGIQAINSIVLARFMDKESFGQYSFLFNSIVPLLTHIVILGQNSSIVRMFSKDSFWNFNWQSYLRNIALMFLALSAILIFTIGSYYDLELNLQFFVLIALLANILLLICANICRSDKQYNFAIVLEKVPPIFFLPLMVLAFWLNKTQLQPLVINKTLSYLIPGVIACFIVFRNKKNSQNPKPIDKNVYTDGLLLWGISLTLMVVDRADNFFLVKLLDYDAVATYCVFSYLVQLYDIAIHAIWSVYSQKFSAQYQPNIKRFLTILVSIAALISIFYFVFGAPLLHLLFKGKYDSGIELLLPFCIICCLRFLYVYPSCHFIGKSSTNVLQKLFAYNLVTVFLKPILTIALIKTSGLIGCLTSGIIIWILRNIIGYWLVYSEKKELKIQCEAEQNSFNH